MGIGAVFPAAALPEELPPFAARIESLGYDELWVIEDCFLSGGLTLAATALAATRDVRVGIGLLPAAVRNPAIAAMEIATLARLYPGRLTVTFGHGVESWMTQIGARPAKRVTALGEVITAVRRLLAGELVTMSGTWVSLDAVVLEHPPEVVPPVLAGTTGAQGMRLAARKADGLLLPEGCGVTFIAQARQLMAEVSRPLPDPLELVVYAWLRIGEDEPARAALSGAVANWFGCGLYGGPTRAAGLDEMLPPGPLSRALADELAVAGTAEQCAAGVVRFAEAGAQRLVLAAVGPDYVEQYEAFARDALPLRATMAGARP
ncbi:MAG TPA: LLM class flavin-dependent oxidoreductase [Solirubrobacteraceae bacterium]|nr:LLM class flavin-dependent oxidoreductase [Solirubrobacteraceae bacterium]